MFLRVGSFGVGPLRVVSRSAIAIITAVVVLGAPFGDHHIRAEQNAVPAPTSGHIAAPSGILPVVVNIPPGITSPEQARPFFDDFSWRSFIALNWPAVPGKHGIP